MIWEYGNAHAPISTGATAGVKQLLIKDREKNEVTASPMFFFPQMTSWDTWGQSNRQTVELKANTIYDFYLVDFFNMTYLDHFRLYTANPGGNQGPINRINLSHLDLWLEHY